MENVLSLDWYYLMSKNTGLLTKRKFGRRFVLNGEYCRNGNNIETFEKRMIGNFRIKGEDDGILDADERNLGMANGARLRIASIVLIEGYHRERYYEKSYEEENCLFINAGGCFHDD
jgi:hypothetical protein